MVKKEITEQSIGSYTWQYLLVGAYCLSQPEVAANDNMGPWDIQSLGEELIYFNRCMLYIFHTKIVIKYFLYHEQDIHYSRTAL